jgi:hypothetical protein
MRIAGHDGGEMVKKRGEPIRRCSKLCGPAFIVPMSGRGFGQAVQTIMFIALMSWSGIRLHRSCFRSGSTKRGEAENKDLTANGGLDLSAARWLPAAIAGCIPSFSWGLRL